MRPVLAALLLVASGCIDPTPSADVPDTEARQLLASLDGSALDAAFERFEADEYRAIGIVTQTVDGRVVARDTLRRGWAREDSGGPLDNPLSSALSDDPPYTDPAVADAYRVETRGDTVLAGQRFVRVEAVLQDTTREVGVRRVEGLIAPDTGAVAAVTVERRTAAAIYTEQSRVSAWAEGEVWRIETESTTDVPLSDPTTVRASWTIIPGR